MPKEHKDRLEPLIRHVSRFAINKIRAEFGFHNVIATNHCLCASKAIYGLPCCQVLLNSDKVELTRIERRWHLFPERTAIASAHGMHLFIVFENVWHQWTDYCLNSWWWYVRWFHRWYHGSFLSTEIAYIDCRWTYTNRKHAAWYHRQSAITCCFGSTASYNQFAAYWSSIHQHPSA